MINTIFNSRRGKVFTLSFVTEKANKLYIDGVIFDSFVLTIFVTNVIYTASNQYYFVFKFIQFYLYKFYFILSFIIIMDLLEQQILFNFIQCWILFYWLVFLLFWHVEADIFSARCATPECKWSGGGSDLNPCVLGASASREEQRTHCLLQAAHRGSRSERFWGFWGQAKCNFICYRRAQKMDRVQDLGIGWDQRGRWTSFLSHHSANARRRYEIQQPNLTFSLTFFPGCGWFYFLILS